MSGGHFDYQQYKLLYIADAIEQLIIDNESQEVNEYGDKKGTFYSKEVIDEFVMGHYLLRQAHAYAQRIDWLVSGDDSPESFIKRLVNDLADITPIEVIRTSNREKLN
jgi:hypothetical protein